MIMRYIHIYIYMHERDVKIFHGLGSSKKYKKYWILHGRAGIRILSLSADSISNE